MLSSAKSRFAGKMLIQTSFFFLLVIQICFAQVNWTKYPGNPIIGGLGGSWNNHVLMPYVIYNPDSARYEMWFSAGEDYLMCQIGFAYSLDGRIWIMHPTPVLTLGSSGSWDAFSLERPCLIRENGQYKMWFTGKDAYLSTAKIGFATSPDGINWTKYVNNPIFEPGTDAWEAGGVMYCYLMPFTGGYKMWYTGSNTEGTRAIGFATSADGISWQRNLNNPVLVRGELGDWDDVQVSFPIVLFKDNKYYMWYSGSTDSAYSISVGLATSYDGISDWNKYDGNPVLVPVPPPSGQWDACKVVCGSVLPVQDSLYMWYDGAGPWFPPFWSYVFKIGLATSLFEDPLPAGIYTIGSGGNFATIQEAFNKLETDGIAGNVTLELIDELYTAPTGQYGFLLDGPVPGAGPNSRVTIKPAENKKIVIQHNGAAVFYLVNTSYVNFDGIGTTGSTTLTVQAIYNVSFPYNEGIIFMDNSDNNVIQNITFIIEDYLRDSGSGFFSIQTGFAPDSNLIQNNFVKQAGFSLYIYNTMTGVMGKGNIIRGNQIGSETDSLVASGIQVTRCENTLIENNIIQNLKVTIPGSEKGQAGIASTFGSGDIIRNNVIHNLKASSGAFCTGIFLFAMAGYYGDNIHVYNNMIYDIQSTSAQTDSKVSGIGIVNHNDSKIYYNSINLSGTGENKLGSAALYILSNCSNTDVKNNIFVNTRDESPYCASAIYDYGSTNLSSDYNDLYFDNTNQNNCLVRIASANYNSLADWQATLNDLNSYVEMPNFVSPYLHIDETIETYLESRGTPIAGIDTDFDGDPRSNGSTDIGADEFNGIYIPTGVDDENILPTVYALEQNFPNPFNPITTIQYSIPNRSLVVLKIYDILGNEVTTLVNEEKEQGVYTINFDANNLASGMYLYRIQAGSFIDTKKMILLK